MDLAKFFEADKFVEWLLTHGIKVALIIIIAFIIGLILKLFVLKFLRKAIRKGLQLARGEKQVDEHREKTIYRVVLSVIKAGLWLVVLITILPEFGVNIGPLLAGLGVAGLALGFGTRSLIQDYISGLFILIEDQFKVGEEVELAGKKGKVKDFNLRRTVVEDGEGVLHYISNSQIKTTSNFSRKS